MWPILYIVVLDICHTICLISGRVVREIQLDAIES